jgi:hypothetical protein
MLDSFPALSAEERDQLKALFCKSIFEIDLEGDDLVFYAECEPPLEEMIAELEENRRLLHKVEEIARVPFQEVVSHAVAFAVDDTVDPDEARSALFAISGRLREMAGLVEREALLLGGMVLDTSARPPFLLLEEERERLEFGIEDEEDNEEPDEGEDGGGSRNGNGNGVGPH